MLAVPDQVIMAGGNAEDPQNKLQKHILTSKVMKADIKNDAMRKAYDETKVRFNVHRRDEKDDEQTVGFLLLSSSLLSLEGKIITFFSTKR